MNKWMVITPAYGRDYRSAEAVLEDFHKEKDFVLNTPQGSTYINKPQIEKGTIIEFRYKGLWNVFIHRVE